MIEKAANLSNVKLFVYDFDGVMTNNTFVLDEEGHEQVSLNRSDGLAVAEIKKRGYKQIILSTEDSKIISHRAKKLGIDCYIGINDKLEKLREFLKLEELDFSEIAYVGNDINDYEAMCLAAFKICPSDAQISIKKISNLVLDKEGGRGVIREILYILTGE
jgi:YrbI family 3-deoxy-D-manno-octulosonate 8-phosphate phosphatase